MWSIKKGYLLYLFIYVLQTYGTYTDTRNAATCVLIENARVHGTVFMLHGDHSTSESVVS